MMQIDNDSRLTKLGFVIYSLTLRVLYVNGGVVPACCGALLAISTLWPEIGKRIAPEFVYKWRDQLFMVHWYVADLLVCLLAW